MEPSWFGLPLLVNRKFVKNKGRFLRYLNKSGIETRDILSGNFLNQPSCKLYNLRYEKGNIKVSQEIEDRGFFIGLPTKKLSKENITSLSADFS